MGDRRMKSGHIASLVAFFAGVLLCPGILSALTVNEVMYHPAGGGRDLEFIEIHNETADPLDLSGYYFSRGIDYVFPPRTFMEPHAYLVLCANEDAVRSAYGVTNTIGNWSEETNLANGGERIELLNSAGALEVSFRYNDRGRWPPAADGTGHSLELNVPWSDPDVVESWAASGALGGSPGRPNSPAELSAVRISEALLSGDAPWIELFNASAEELDIGGLRLTSARDDLSQATLPDGATIGPRGWTSFNAADIGLDLRVDEGRVFLALVHRDATRVLDAHVFEPVEEGRTGARLETSAGEGGAFFSENAPATRDAANELDVARVVINELHYHPIDDLASAEFIELHNPGTNDVDLTGWRFSDGVDYTFPAGAMLAAGGYLVIGGDAEKLRERYGLSQAQVLGPETAEARADFGGLANSGERVILRDGRDNVVDMVDYDDGGEWPLWPDGLGSSMELVDSTQDNTNPQAWDSSDDSDEAPLTRVEYRGVYGIGEEELHFLLLAPGITLVDDVEMVALTTRIEMAFSLFEFGETWSYAKGTADPSSPIEAWRQEEFDDSGWLTGPTPIGFGDNDIATEITDMRRVYAAMFFRKEFDVADLSAIDGLFLEVDYDDGFAAYLNGVEVVSSNLADRATTATAPTLKNEVLTVVLNDRKGLLHEGTNLLAVQVHNSTLRSNDFRFQARLFAGELFIEDGPNLITDGTFETEEYAASWVREGTHVRSGRTIDRPLTGAGSLKLVASGRGDNKVNRVETSNDGLMGLLRDTEHTISFATRWVVGSPTLLTHGTYNGGDEPNYAAAVELSLPETFGTPGAPNSSTERRIVQHGEANLGPVVRGVRHTPTMPLDGEEVRVEARIYDPDGVTSAEVVYTLGEPRPDGDAALEVAPLADLVGDGLFTGTIPPQEAGRPVLFFIRTVDGGGRVGRYPGDRLARTHPVVLDATDPSPRDYPYLIYRHEPPPEPEPVPEPLPGAEPVPEPVPLPPYPEYRFWIDDASEAYMDARRLLSNDLVDGTFVLDGEHAYYQARIRFSGSPFARGKWGGSYRIELPKDQMLQGTIEKFNLEQHQGAGGLDARERISSYLLRYNQGETKVPFLRHWLVDWELPGRVAGPREHVMAPNREFLNRWYPDDGDGLLFEMDDRHSINDNGGRSGSTDGRVRAPPYGPAEKGPDKEYYRYFFNPRAGNIFDEWGPFLDFARLIGPTSTTSADFGERVWDEVDVEEFCRIWSVRLNTDDWDHWGGSRGKNCYFYQPSIDGRWVFLSWDLELTYGNLNAFLPPPISREADEILYSVPFDEARRFLNHPPIKRLYYRILKELVDGPFQSSFLTEYLEMLEGVGMQNTQVGLLDGYIDQRRELLLEAVAGATAESLDFVVLDDNDLPVIGALTIEAGPVDVGSTTMLRGQAPVEISHIEAVVDGAPRPEFAVTFAAVNLLEWGAQLSLPEGTSSLRLVGFDRFGEIVDTTELAVTVLPPVPDLDFVRGDADGSGALGITDAIVTLLGVLKRGRLDCLDASDTNDDGQLDLTDTLVLLQFLFLHEAPPPPSPFPGVGPDPTADALGCASR